MSLNDAQEKISIWKEDYNHFRTHSSLGDLAPNEKLPKHIKIALKSNLRLTQKLTKL
jgi:hypothetical protein